jgi:hypothetical protein
MYTTLGAPSGGFGGSNGAQSGSESRMSTLITPLKLSAIATVLRQAAWMSPLILAARARMRIIPDG